MFSLGVIFPNVFYIFGLIKGSEDPDAEGICNFSGNVFKGDNYRYDV